LYVRKLSDNSQLFYYGADGEPPSGYSASTNEAGLENSSFDAATTPQPGMVPIYSFTIPARDGSLIYYLSPNKETPIGFTQGKVQFYAYPTQQPGTIPVYLHTIIPNGAQVYYYSTSETAPAGYRTQGGPVFYVYGDK
jgi:hypothetical protein